MEKNMTVNEYIKHNKIRNWKVVENGITLVTEKNCPFLSEEELRSIGKKEVITSIVGADETTIVVSSEER